MYSITDGTIEKKTAKGINRSVTEREITHANFEHTLFEGTSMTHEMKRIYSRNHQLYSATISKSSLSAFDDKRFILNDGISTLAYGHHSIPSLSLINESSDSE